ncbi:hypothetical protein H8L32_02930 [Undibacterium sp. CY18W]|uniref:Uncharacterized protein n=1 Tax=Undibacterium hunanense TaxID=2762292 RepID=A0ABR6ZLM4_9BURK|nr:glycine zipper domain-containing protein [Undibacterium hunanense]MBC3916433.1 hypothetical protein [Undibacterium hunanense]
MTATCFEGVSTNPDILAMADRVFGVVRLSIQRATCVLNNVPATSLPQKGVEKDAYDFLKSYQVVNRSAVTRLSGISRTSGRRVDIGDATLLGSSIKLNHGAPDNLFEQARANKYFDGLKLSSATLAGLRWDAASKKAVVTADKSVQASEILNALAFRRVFADAPGTATVVAGAAATTASAPASVNARELHLKLKSLKAIRRFGWEITDWGNDNIYCGGDGLDSLQQHVKAGQFAIHTFKRDGESFDIRPDRTFVKFNLGGAGAWPRAYMANVFLAEKDVDGGFVEFLQKLWDAIGAEVIKLATSLAMSAIGAVVGAVALSEIPVLGTIVGAVIGAVIGYVVGWLLDTAKDDIFESPDNPLGMILPSQNFRFNGGRLVSPDYTQEFSVGSARYLMTYYWQLVV